MNVITELTYAIIFFSYGIICSLLYNICTRIEKRLNPKLLRYILDAIYVTICFIPFFYFYVNVLDGILKLYELIFFIFGFAVYYKYIHRIFCNILLIKKPPILDKIITKIKSIITK